MDIDLWVMHAVYFPHLSNFNIQSLLFFFLLLLFLLLSLLLLLLLTEST